MRSFTSRHIIPLYFSVVFLRGLSQHAGGTNGGFDHRAHSVPGANQFVYDLDGNGYETIHLNGVDSHSHYFNAGPPVVSGVIVSFVWRKVDTNEVFCTQMECDEAFPVGETQIQLTVTDNTGDVSASSMTVTVFPQRSLTETPRIDDINPGQGQAQGGNIVTITGAFLYRDSRVFFDLEEATEVQHIDLNTITCIAPGGTGTAIVTVQSSVGTSNGVQYVFQDDGDSVPIRFLFDTWTNPDGSEYLVEEITCITVGRDHRYYMGSLTGYVTVTYVDRDLVVQSSCTGAYMGVDRSITGIGFNPLDPYNRVFVSTNTHFFEGKGERWDNGKIEAVDVGADDCPVRGPTIISGLPVSNHDHGVSSIVFLPDGRMLIAVGSFTNAGVSTPGDGIGGVPENPLSGAVVVANYLSPTFNGEIVYDQYENPGNALVVSGSVETYVVGLRNCFGLLTHSNGQVYATDNGPNVGFGLTSVSCTEDAPDPESGDKLLRLVPGMYYGHPNRNRGRFDQRQCAFRYIDEPSTDNYMAPIGTMTSSTNGIIEYRANVFKAALKGDLLMSKVAFGADGLLWRAELTGNGNALTGNPYQFFGQSGVSMTMGLYGEIVMPQLKKYRVLALRADEPGPTSVQVISVNPQRGPAAGGTELFVTGHFLNSPDLVIMVGGSPCTNIVDIKYQHVRCITPPGSGKVSVIATANGISSTSYGHEFEYL